MSRKLWNLIGKVPWVMCLAMVAIIIAIAPVMAVTSALFPDGVANNITAAVASNDMAIPAPAKLTHEVIIIANAKIPAEWNAATLHAASLVATS